MTPLTSFLETRSTCAAVVLVAVLHAAVLFGFAQYDHTRPSIGQRPTAPVYEQPLAVVFVAGHTAPVQTQHAYVQPLVRAPVPKPAPTPSARGVWAAERSAQVKEEPAGASQRAGPTDVREQHAVPPRLLAQPTPSAPSVPSAPAAVHSEEASPEPAQLLQAAKPDYAYNPQPDYPVLLREQGVGGVVWLRVWVDSEGLPGEIKLAKGSGYRLLDDAALRAVQQWRFTPARRGGNKLASWVEFPIRFTLNG